MAGLREFQKDLRYDVLRAPESGHALQGIIDDQGLTEKIEFSGSFSCENEQQYLESIRYTDNRDSVTEAEKAFDPVTGYYKNGNLTAAEITARGWTAPTWAEIKAEWDDMVAEYDTFASKRKREYPTWQEQVDQLWHDIDDGKLDKTGTWYKAVKAIKDANP